MIWLLQTVDVTMTVAVDATMVADADVEMEYLVAEIVAAYGLF